MAKHSYPNIAKAFSQPWLVLLVRTAGRQEFGGWRRRERLSLDIFRMTVQRDPRCQLGEIRSHRRQRLSRSSWNLRWRSPA